MQKKLESGMSPVCASVNIIPQRAIAGRAHTLKAKQDITSLVKNFVLGNGLYHFDLWPRATAPRDGATCVTPFFYKCARRKGNDRCRCFSINRSIKKAAIKTSRWRRLSGLWTIMPRIHGDVSLLSAITSRRSNFLLVSSQ